jgi:hypothetical protein
MRRCTCLLAAFAVALSKAQAADSAQYEIPFEFREGLIWIKATILQSTKPLNLLLDTGAGASVINLPVAEQLGLKPGKPISVRGVNSTLTGYWLNAISATANGVPLPADYLAVDLAKLSSSCERPVDGLLGADFLRGRIAQIDFNAQKLRILNADSPTPRPFRHWGRGIKGEVALSEPDAPRSMLRAPRSDAPSIETLPLQLRPCGMRVPITVNGRKRQWVRLDTGCATPLQWVNSTVQPEQCSKRIAIGLAEMSIPQAETTVQIGAAHFEKVATGMHESQLFPGEAGLLGNGLLSRFSRITIDARAGRVVFEQNHLLQ